MVMHFVRAICKSKSSLCVPHVRKREPLRNTSCAMHLDCFVNDVTALLGDHCLYGAHPNTGLSVAESIHSLRCSQHHQPHSFHLDTGPRYHFHVLAEVDKFFPETFPGSTSINHHFDRFFCRANRSHAVMDAARAETKLADFEAATLA